MLLCWTGHITQYYKGVNKNRWVRKAFRKALRVKPDGAEFLVGPENVPIGYHATKILFRETRKKTQKINITID